MKYYILTLNPMNNGSYQITLIATLQNKYSTSDFTFQWNLTLYHVAPRPNRYKPAFIIDLQTQIIYAGNTSLYALPPTRDMDNDNVTIRVNLKNASDFTKYDNGSFKFNPGQKEIGYYVIEVNLTDSGLPPKSKIETLILQVYE